MHSARQSVSHNIKALMDNSVPRVSQKLVGELIDREQPQVSQRLRGHQPWTLDELEQIAEFFGVDITLLVDNDPHAVYRWLAENGRIDVRDRPGFTRTCNHPYGSQDPLPFDEGYVIDLRDHIITPTHQNGPTALLVRAS